MAMQYARQLANPSLVRTRGQMNNNQAYPMQPQQGGFYPPPPLQHQDSNSWMVPPYPGPPTDQNQQQRGYDKSDYHPQAEWANEGSSQNQDHREEEEAWERARTTGVTAHLTGQASPPPSGRSMLRDENNSQGFLIPNNEEDEAWERARTQGPTAHLTGNGQPKMGGNAL